jgi:hypothetical protein
MEVSEWVERTAVELLEGRARAIAAIEHGSAAPPLPIAVTKRAEDPSSISVSRRTDAGKTARRRRAVWALLALLTVLVAFWVVRTRRPEPSVAPAVAVAAPSVSVIPEPSVEELIEEATPPIPGKPKPVKTAPKVAPKTKTSATTTLPTGIPTSNADCTPPYTWDSLGRRIYKRHCLNQP